MQFLSNQLFQFFMCHLEDKLKRDGMIPEFYKRFVDDALSKMPNAAAARFFLKS